MSKKDAGFIVVILHLYINLCIYKNDGSGFFLFLLLVPSVLRFGPVWQIWQFLRHFLIPSGTNFSTNIKYTVWGWTKIQNNICWSSEMWVKDNFLKIVEISKKFETLFCLSWIPALQKQADHPELDQSCFTEYKVL